MSAPAFKRPESVLVVVHTGDQILLMERCSPAGFWQSVTGSLRDSESPLRCAIRELAEETGFEAVGLRDLQVTRRFRIAPEWRHRYAPGVKENVEHAFALRLPRALAPKLNPAEHRAHRWMPVAEAVAAASSWTDRAAMRCALGLPEKLSNNQPPAPVSGEETS